MEDSILLWDMQNIVVKHYLKNIFGIKIKEWKLVLPYNYFPNNDPDNIPLLNWKCHANLMFSNWLNLLHLSIYTI